MDIKKIRGDFPILNRKINGFPLVYFDNAATSLRPRQVLEAIAKYYERYNANVHRGIHTLSVQATDAYELARKKVADFIGVDDIGEIIFLRNTDEAINLVANTWGLENIGRGDEIVVTIAEHHANFIPWQQLALTKGAELKIVAVDEQGELDLGALAKALTKKTKLVAYIHVSNVLGTINDTKAISSIVRKLAPSAKILIDGAQAVPHIPVNLSKIDCDFYAFSAHKMLGPTGVGVLWGKRELLDAMPPYEFGGDMISKVTIEKSTWNELPWKYEAGTPNIEGAIGLGAAVDYLSKIGMENVREHEIGLLKYAMQKLKTIKEVKILGPKDPNKRCGVIAFNIIPLESRLKTADKRISVLGVPPHDIAGILDRMGIEIRSGFNCAEPLMAFLGKGPVARASFYIYNTHEEIDSFVDAINKVKEVFKI